MVLCGEAVARFGAERDLPLPYRGQGPPDRMTDEDEEDMQALPEGPCRAVHLRSFMSRSEIKCSGPIPHAGLGLQGYVQFSSPIRRYSDLLAHYQVKALLRGEPPPLSVSDLDTIVSHCGARQREVRRAEGAVERYWLQEYLRRLPANTVLTAVMLKWLRADGSPLALMLVEEVGMETVMKMQRDVRVGDSVDVIIAEADPARDKLRLVEAPPSFREAQMRGLAYGEGEEGGLEDGGEEDRREEGELEAGEGESSGEAWEGSVDVETVKVVDGLCDDISVEFQSCAKKKAGTDVDRGAVFSAVALECRPKTHRSSSPLGSSLASTAQDPPALLPPGELAGQHRTGPTGPPPPWGARWPAPHRTHRSSSPLGSSLASTAQDPPGLLPPGELAGQHRTGPTGPPPPWGARWPAPHRTHRSSSPLGSSLASTAQDPPGLLPPGELAGQHRTGPTGPPPPWGARWPAPHRTHRASSPLVSSLASTAQDPPVLLPPGELAGQHRTGPTGPPGELAGQHRTGPTGPPPPWGARWPAPHRTHRSVSGWREAPGPNLPRERMGCAKCFAAVFLRR
ncbi:unnamed protein product [Closterium sp. Naga37s-1]|nr:unnamed protein product [Closterium sp. Naga37s-1]